MLSKQDLWNWIEERWIGWSWDCRVPILLVALSAHENLPTEMREQEQKLNALALKAELFGRYREALAGLTSNLVHMNWKSDGQPPGSVTLPPLPSALAREGNSKDDAVIKLITEMNRLEKEFSDARVDYGAILRFLRKA